MVEAHTDSSSLRPYVKPIKELVDPTIVTTEDPINLARSTSTSITEMDNPDMRASLAPFPTGETVVSAADSARKTVIGLSVGIIVALILMGTVIYLMVLKYRRTKRKDEEAASEAAAASENGEKGDMEVVSPAPPRYSLEDPAMTEIVLPPAYLEAGKSDEGSNKVPEDSAVEEKTDVKVKKSGSLRVSHARNMRILV
ncbi:hypothetical protein TWF718_003744 [Orbilia javanica]|uniref:Uncharacterized protein n=1 Tax=Orbilia javanica TaxID=47235 RepID=A0AAN8MTU9_9PEZI